MYGRVLRITTSGGARSCRRSGVLIVGRSGSGKSSFAEGLEYLLTGRNYRWEKRPKVWLEGWRNLFGR